MRGPPRLSSACDLRKYPRTLKVRCLLPGGLFLQVRTRVLNDDLATDFARWHPGFTHHSGPVELVA